MTQYQTLAVLMALVSASGGLHSQRLLSQFVVFGVIGAAVAFLFVMWRRNQPRDPSQNAQSESDWRIHPIPYETLSIKSAFTSGWMASKTGTIMSFAGVIMFFGGFIYSVFAKNVAGVTAGFGVGWPMAGLGTLITNRRKRRNWLRIEAACIDREHRRVYSSRAGGSRGGYTWRFRLLCRFNLDGKEYTVTPYYYRSCGSERGVLRLYAKAITGNQTCFLWVNSRNPLETELSAGGLADFLLH